MGKCIGVWGKCGEVWQSVLGCGVAKCVRVWVKTRSGVGCEKMWGRCGKVCWDVGRCGKVGGSGKIRDRCGKVIWVWKK